MRSRSDSRSGKTPPATLEKHFREIVVGSGRAQEPYIIAFHYASDNVSGSPLGTLFGFFEVEIHDQDAAYIVNFLASVAKKEYFANPRRNPVESFEAALHKINVALAEIVKHGNVSWLGHLHGAVGSVSQNSLLFSVTGEGEIYLARAEAFHSISTGLADTESEPHPLKTFVEVSSGELYDADLIFALSPSIWSLFSPEDLRRSLNRLGPAGFEQFLRTALVNELPIAAVNLITCSAPVELQSEMPPKETRPPAVNLSNVWSGKPFDEALRQKKSPPAPTPEPKAADPQRTAYTDQKTGHIYVQASTEETFEAEASPWKERFELFSHTFDAKTRNWSITLRKITRRINKGSMLTAASISRFSGRLSRSLSRRIRSLKRNREENRQKKAEIEALTKATEETLSRPAPEPAPDRVDTIYSPANTESEPSETSIAPSVTAERVRRFFNREPRTEVTLATVASQQLSTLNERVTAIRLASVPALGRVGDILSDWSLRGRQSLRTGMLRLQKFWSARQPRERWVLIGLATLIVVGMFAAIFWSKETVLTPDTTDTTVLTPAPTPPLPAFPPADEPLATLLAGSRTVYPTNNSRTIALVSLNDTPVLVTEKSIVNLKTQESTTAPEPIRFATAMDDLDAVFAIGSESGTLFLWSAVTKKFVSNTLPLPAGATIDAIGSYLTYLYVLDRGAGVIYRFPRSEGGFGTATAWSKEPVNVSDRSIFAVYENILLVNKAAQPTLYTRGRNTNLVFMGPVTTISTDALAFDTRSGDVLALDRMNKRIIRWSVTGTLLAQYFHSSFNEVEAFAVSPDGTELLLSHQGATTAWRIP
ncbi:MAG: hypothetical protein WBO92_04260 [Candidatus Moraniibacteriota bacterium]